jgi:hypothetical protein
MSRRVAALKPQLNRIRAWAYEGSTDAWIAHQLDTTAEAVRAFRLEHGIERGGPAPLAPITPDSVVEAMLAEEAAAAEAGTELSALEPAPEQEPEAAIESAPARAPRSRGRRSPTADADEAAQSSDAAPSGDTGSDEESAPAAEAPSRGGSRRRGARSGAARSAPADEPAAAAPVEETPDAGEAAAEDEPGRPARKRRRGRGRGRGGGRALEARILPGSVLLLDPAVLADATFQEHWQDAGNLRVEVSADAIVLRRAAEPEPDRS